MVTRRALLSLLVAAAACDTGFQKESIVVDLRVLAVRCDPAEVVVDVDPSDLASIELPDIEVTTLVGDPEGPRTLAYTLIACPTTDTGRCDDPTAPMIRFADSTTEDVETTPPAGTLRVDVALLQASLAADTYHGLGGIPVQIELAIHATGTGQTTVYASKQIFYSARIPAGRTENQNPSLAELDADTLPFGAGAPLSVAVLQQVTLEPVEPAGVRETYVVPTLDGDQRTFTENLRYSWLATAGEFSDDRTGGPIDAFGNHPLLRTKWTAPKTEGMVRLWLVQRDERGGTYWTERAVMVHK